MTLPTETEHWINSQWVKADEAIETLAAEKKRAGVVYDDRTRIISKFKATLRDMKADEGQAELVQTDNVLGPELETLLRAPLHGIG